MRRCLGCDERLFENREDDIISFNDFRKYQFGKDISGKIAAFCNLNCYYSYWDRYIVEVYEGEKIYAVPRRFEGEEITGYIPYIDCSYWFRTLEECRERINSHGVGIIF